MHDLTGVSRTNDRIRAAELVSADFTPMLCMVLTGELAVRSRSKVEPTLLGMLVGADLYALAGVYEGVPRRSEVNELKEELKMLDAETYKRHLVEKIHDRQAWLLRGLAKEKPALAKVLIRDKSISECDMLFQPSRYLSE